MWYTYTPPDEEITRDIDEAIKEIVNHDNYKFVWYVNPKMTIPEVFHVQVFWTDEWTSEGWRWREIDQSAKL